MTRRHHPKLLLFPGAGSSSSHPSLVAIERAVRAGSCVRADFPYRLAGRRIPDRAPVLVDTVVERANAMGPGPLVLGGRSMGGRMCSMAVADGRIPRAVGLVMVSYPLHPPRRPDSLRVDHFPRLRVPCLFVHGTNDQFGSPDELEAWTATIPASVTHVWIERGRHELLGAHEQVATSIAEWLKRLVG